MRRGPRRLVVAACVAVSAWGAVRDGLSPAGLVVAAVAGTVVGLVLTGQGGGAR